MLVPLWMLNRGGEGEITSPLVTLQEPVISPAPELYLKFNNATTNPSVFIDSGTCNSIITQTGGMSQVKEFIVNDVTYFTQAETCGGGVLNQLFPGYYLTITPTVGDFNLLGGNFEIGFRFFNHHQGQGGNGWFNLWNNPDPNDGYNYDRLRIFVASWGGLFLSMAENHYNNFTVWDVNLAQVIPFNTFGTVKLVRSGSTLTMYINDVLRWTTTDFNMNFLAVKGDGSSRRFFEPENDTLLYFDYFYIAKR